MESIQENFEENIQILKAKKIGKENKDAEIEQRIRLGKDAHKFSFNFLYYMFNYLYGT